MSLLVDIKKKLGNFHLNVSFETDSGVLGLLGESGCGKSMTLKCIAGIEKPDEGKIILNSVTLFDSARRINVPPQKRRLGYLFQNYALFPNMNVRQNILCGLRNEADKAARARTLDEIIELMQLRGLEKHRPNELSGGQQQRVALGRILVGSPNLLMLDEPFSALDSHLRSQLQLQLQNLLKQFGKDVLMVTHDRDEAYRLCHRIALIDNGKILANKGAKELFLDPGSRKAALLTGCKNIADAVKSRAYEVTVPAWGVKFTTADPVRDELCAIGIRAHYFNTETAVNRNPVNITGEMEEPFEYMVQFRYKDQDESFPDLLWRLQKGNNGSREPFSLGVEPENVLLLYG